MSRFFNISLTAFYLFYVVYVLVFFFIDNPFTYMEWLILGFHLFFVISCIIHIIKNNVMNSGEKVLWVVLSLFFPFALVFYIDEGEVPILT